MKDIFKLLLIMSSTLISASSSAAGWAFDIRTMEPELPKVIKTEHNFFTSVPGVLSLHILYGQLTNTQAVHIPFKTPQQPEVWIKASNQARHSLLKGDNLVSLKAGGITPEPSDNNQVLPNCQHGDTGQQCCEASRVNNGH